MNQARFSPLIITAFVLALAAITLPVHATADLLAGGTARLPSVVTGVWIFKAMLLVHALLLLALTRLLPGPSAGGAWHAPAAEDNQGTERLLLAALLAIGLALRLYKLGEGLWFDEIQTLVSYVRLPVLQIVSTFDSQNQHMLYALLARGSVLLFGESAWSLRLPAALLGVGSLAALYALAKTVTGRTEAFLATAFLTVSYHHVWFSQNARGYTGLLLFTLVATLLLQRMLSNRYVHAGRTAAMYALMMALAMFTHVTAAFVLLAHMIIWAVMLVRQRKAAERVSFTVPAIAFVLSATFTLQLYAFVLPQFVGVLTEPTMEGVATEWKDPVWLVMETLRGLARGLPGGWFAVTAAAAVLTAGVVSFWRQDRFVSAAMLLPPMLLGGILLALRHNLWPRFFFFAAGFAVLLVIRGANTLVQFTLRHRRAALATGALSTVVLLSAAQLPAAWYPKQDYAAAARFIAAHRSTNDAVVTVDMSNYAFNVYGRANYLAVDNDQQLRAIERSHARTWFLYIFPTRLAAVQPQLWARLQTDYRPAAAFNGTVGGGTIFIRVKP